jgi:acyl-CoA oxidase
VTQQHVDAPTAGGTTADRPTPAPDQDGAASTPDAGRVQRVLDGRYAFVREQVREHLADPRFAPVFGLSVEEHRERTFEQLVALGQTEGPRLLFPTSVGGGGDLGGAITAFEMLGFTDLSLLVKAGVQFGLFGGAINHLGNEEHQRRYLPDVMTAALPGCFAMTETGHGSDVQSLRTTATYDPDAGEFVLQTPDEDARKDYIGNAARDGRLAAVFAQLVTRGETHGVHCFLVPIRDEDGQPMPGVRIEDCGQKMGLNGVDNGRLWFDQVRVPREALLDRYAQVAADGTYTSPIDHETRRFFTMLGTLVQGRVSVSGAALSAAKVALTIAVRYGAVRRQFKAPGADREVVLLDFRMHQRRLLPLLARTYALHAAQTALVEELHRSFDVPRDELPDRQELEAMAAGIKAASTWHATHTIQTCREACGGAGYLSENRFASLKADTDVFATFEGDNTVLLQLVAKGLLTDYRDEFGSLDTLGTVRFVADQVVETVVERTRARKLLQSLAGVVPGRDEDRDLFDRDWQLELFAWREEHVISGVARRLKAGIDGGRDAFEVFNEAQDHVLLAARAHVDRVILERFHAFVDACDDPGVADLLGDLASLHALATLEQERGWFLEHGRLNGARTKAIIGAVNDLCARLRPHAELLVDAFGIPDACVAAPIALGEERRRQEEKHAAGG